MTIEPTFRQYSVEEYIVTSEPFYEPVKDEIELFESAYREKIPVLLKGPTGCGKTRFVEHMAWRLRRPWVTAPATTISPPVTSSVVTSCGRARRCGRTDR